MSNIEELYSDIIETKCKEGLDIICQKAIANGLADSKWTTEIQNYLSQYGQKLGFGVHASRADDAENEWLYDVTWYEYSSSEHLLSIPLAAEIEWNSSDGEIFYDFEKLLQSTAEHKLMIFQKGRSKWKALMDKLEHSVHLYKRRLLEDRYLFVCYVNGDNEVPAHFEYRLVVRK